MESQTRATKDQVLKDKQDLNDNQDFEKGYNEAIIATIAEMKSLKDIIYQAGFYHSLEKAQISIGHEIFQLKVFFPIDFFVLLWK